MLHILFISLSVPIVIVGAIGIFGKHWGKQWVKDGVMTMDEMYDYGYLGCFFAKIFGF